MKIVFELVFNPSSFIIAAGLTANGLTPMKNGLLMALQEIVKNGKLFFSFLPRGICLPKA